MQNLKNDADFVIHVGDIRANNQQDCQYTEFSGPAEILKLSPIPVFIIPGDNEFTGKYKCGTFSLCSRQS